MANVGNIADAAAAAAAIEAAHFVARASGIRYCSKSCFCVESSPAPETTMGKVHPSELPNPKSSLEPLRRSTRISNQSSAIGSTL